jgi:alanyl-tRNA synthetase
VSDFAGYEGTEGSSRVISLYKGGEPKELLSAGDEGAIILSSSPFYAESGGQVGDRGILAESGTLFQVVGASSLNRARCSRWWTLRKVAMR